MPFLGGPQTSGGGGSGNATAQNFSGTLDINGEDTVSGLTNADTGHIDLSFIEDPLEYGDLYAENITPTGFDVKSTAGFKHANLDYTGTLITT